MAPFPVVRLFFASLLTLTALFLAPALAQAAAGAGATVNFPTQVTVGDTGVPASVTLQNLNSAPDTGSTNTVCNFGEVAPCSTSNGSGGDRGIALTPSCKQLSAGLCAAPAGADPDVFALSSTGTGRFGTACAGVTFAITVRGASQGRVAFAPPSGTHVTLPGAGSTCIIDFTFDVVKSPADVDPATPGNQTAQVTEHTQVVGPITPGALSAGGRGTSTTTVLRATPAITTQASANTSFGSGVLTDTATVSGRVNPQAGATITFNLYAPGDDTCAGNPLFVSTVSYPVAGGSVTSASFTPTQVGTYRWIATYSGDVNNAPVSGACNDPTETTVVGKASTTIATNASAGTTLGNTISDTATVSGRFNPQAGATITFNLYAPGDATCSGAPVFQSPDVPYPVAGGSVTSASFTPTQVGTYRWIATYSGDANNAAVSGACNDPNENVVVSHSRPTLTTTASADITLGAGTLNDAATVSGRVNPQPGATIDFRLYGPDDATCSGAPVFESANVPYPVAGGAVSSESHTPTRAGTYRWIATYSGDANNVSVAGACNDAGENVTVTAPAPVQQDPPATSGPTNAVVTPAVVPATIAPPALVVKGDPRVVVRNGRQVLRSGLAVVCPRGGPACAARLSFKTLRRSPRTGRIVDVFLTRRGSTFTVQPGAQLAVDRLLTATAIRLLRRPGSLRVTARAIMRAGAAPPVVREKTLRVGAPARR